MSTPEQFDATDAHTETAATSVSERVVQAVSETTGKDLTEFEPLYHVIDPDALNTLFDSTPGGSRTGGQVVFTVADCEVVVDSTGSVEVTPHDDAAASEYEVAEQDLR